MRQERTQRSDLGVVQLAVNKSLVAPHRRFLAEYRSITMTCHDIVQTITVPASSDAEIAAYPREYALLRQLEHDHKGQIPLEVGVGDERDLLNTVWMTAPCLLSPF